MKTTQCPNCRSDIIIEEDASEKDLVNCANCEAELEIITLHPLQLADLTGDDNSPE